MTDGPHGARVPRAMADVPPPALADGEAVAKAWLLELVAEAPLARAAAVPVAELAARGPALCAALLAAVGSAAELDRLRPGADRARLAADAGALAGAEDAAGAAAAIAALRRALWAVLRAELRDLDAAATAALAERIGYVADVVTAAVPTRRRSSRSNAPSGRPRARATTSYASGPEHSGSSRRSSTLTGRACSPRASPRPAPRARRRTARRSRPRSGSLRPRRTATTPRPSRSSPTSVASPRAPRACPWCNRPMAPEPLCPLVL